MAELNEQDTELIEEVRRLLTEPEDLLGVIEPTEIFIPRQGFPIPPEAELA